MAVYHKDNLEWFCDSIESILNQTTESNDIVIVRDGAVPSYIENKLKYYEENNINIRVIRLKKNKGLGNALNEGIKYCKNELVARMDADDISVKNRFEIQLEMFNNHTDLSILGGQIAEFDGATDNIISYREVPLTHSDIMKFAKLRSPFNHPTVMYKKSDVLAAGGYGCLLRTEDYELWLNMLSKGVKTANLQNVLLYYRLTPDNSKRKSTWLQYKEAVKLCNNSRKLGTLNAFEFIYTTILRTAFFITPLPIKRLVYIHLLRRKHLG